MKKELRIPTILGLLIIGISLTATIILFRNGRTLLTQANPDTTPSEVKITNITESSFTVSWITAGNTSGAVNFGENSTPSNIVTDDRDQTTGTAGQYSTHHLTLRYLKAGTKYYFKIISGGQTYDNNGELYLVTTAPEIGPSTNQANPVYGTVISNDGSPADGAILYFQLANGTPLSTLVKSSGNWLITLNNVRLADLTGFVNTKSADKMEIFVQAGSLGTAKAVTTLATSAPVSQITLGKTYDFSSENLPATTQEQSSTSRFVNVSPTPSATASATASSTIKMPAISKPASGSAVPADRPLFEGTGIPGKTVTIKVESTTPVTGTTVVGQNGNWNWTPPSGLTVGNHTVTVTTTDSSGKLQQLIRPFTVLASGTQVAESATPSATVTPKPTLKPTPTPTVKPTLKPSPLATASTAPASGNLTPTLFLLLLGLTLIVLGGSRFILLDRQ